MAKIKYNIKLWADKAANLEADTTVFKENDFIFATDAGVLKKGDGVKAYAKLGSIGTVAKWKDIEGKPEKFDPSAHDHAVEDITDWPTTFPPEIGITAITAAAGNHDHVVVAKEATNLEAAETLQGLAEALSARIAELDGRVALLEIVDEGGEVE